MVFEALQALFLSLMRKHLIYSHEVEQWYISALGLVTDEVRYFQERRLTFKGGHPHQSYCALEGWEARLDFWL